MPWIITRLLTNSPCSTTCSHTLSYLISKVSFSFTSVRNETCHNNMMAEKEKHGDLKHPLRPDSFGLRGLPPKHAYRSQQTAQGLWHMLLSQPTSDTPTALSLSLSPRLPFFNSLLLSRTLPEQTNGYPPISAVSLAPSVNLPVCSKIYQLLTMWQEKGCCTGAHCKNCPAPEHQRDSV